jgi:sec-independent protein translocase protein TatA
MFGLGAPEMAIIMVVVLIIFGAGKLPQVFGSMGKGIREFRESSLGEPKRDADPEPKKG